MKTKQVTGDEFWLRCVFCGDSQRDKTKSHFSVNLRSGKYHCYRCNAGGRLSTRLLLRLVEEAGVRLYADLGGESQETLESLEMRLSPGPATLRPSALTRYNVEFHGRQWDAFKMVNATGSTTGILLRSAGGEKASYIVGERGLLVPRDSEFLQDGAGGSGIVLRVVEGPYDVLESRDVGVAGFLSRTRLSDLLQGWFVRLCPDGDVWTSRDHMVLFSTAVRGLFSSRRGPWPVSVEYIPDGKDPDEVPPNERTLITTDTFLKSVRLRGFIAI